MNMGKSIKNWKETAIEVFVATPKKNGKVDWKSIITAIEEVHKDAFKDCKNPAKRLQDFFRTSQAKEMLAEYESKQTPIEVSTTETKKTHEVEMTEAGGKEIVHTENVESRRNADGSQTKTIDMLAQGDMGNLSDTDILKVLGYNPEVFKLMSSTMRRGTWQQQAGKDGDVIDLYSYRLSANVKPLGPDEVSLETVKRMLCESVEGKTKKLLTVSPAPVEGDKIAILSIADLHLGKLAWAPECGESYDHKIATKRFNHIINSAVSILKKEEKIEKIVFYWSQDFFHFDTPQVTTTAGTRQDTDVRWQKMFEYGTRLLTEAVEVLKQIAPVETFYVRSNHDTQTSFYAMSYLAAYFHNDPLVTVDTGASPRKYIRYGVNLFGFGHGDKEGKRIFNMMSIERPQDWGNTWNREFFLGHFHSYRAFEENGVTARYLSSPTGTDAWHCEEGFLGAQKASQLFIRSKNAGQVAEYTINVQ